MDNMPSPSPQKPHYDWNETIRTVLLALLLAMTFRSLAFEPFHIPSGSMKSNLLIGDYLFVSKYSYGYSRYSFPFGFKFFEGRVPGSSKPERGDVVVFRLPSNPRIDFIKRIVGLPGDSIQMREGTLYINGTPLPRDRLDEWKEEDAETGTVKSIPRFEETLPNGKKIAILKEEAYSRGDDTPILIVPPHHYFMMGDNRDNSHDSRFRDIGFIPEENLVGRAEMIFFSADERFQLLNPLTWFPSLRYGRFFNRIE
jgi:signal peptidase I